MATMLLALAAVGWWAGQQGYVSWFGTACTEEGYDGHDEEAWVRYYVETGELDLGDWAHTLPAAERDAAVHAMAASAEHIEERLRALGRAITATPRAG